MRKPVIKKGDKFGRLTAIKFSHRNKYSQQFWLFKCDCGNEKVIGVNEVKNGNTKSCGCFKKKNLFKHGMINTKTYRNWAAMKDRCLNKNHPEYKNWGGRGITICKRWLKFENFYADMGECPKGKSLDRINNSGNYCPENCRWATQKQQQNNRRNNHLLTYQRKTQTIAQWAREIGINDRTLRWRLRKGWNIGKALSNN